jgi:DNA (cytosine-5)-methyltransferase 1
MRPKVFVAENVSGLIRGVAKGYFLEILGKLKASGYRVGCKVLDAQWLGVPQARQRTIFIGVREDLSKEPVFPKPLPYRYSLRDALPDIVRAKYGPAWRSPDAPSPTVSASRSYNPATSHQGLELVEARITGGSDKATPTFLGTEPNQLEIDQLDMSRFAISKEWDKLKPGEASDKYFNLVRPHPDEPCPTICAAHGHPGIASVTHPTEKRKLTIAELKQICAFPADFILTGSYAQQWERLGRAVPPVMMFHIAEVIRDQVLNAK